MLVQRENDLAVAVALEVVLLGQLGAVAFMVVELPVHDRMDIVLGIMEWLVAVRAEIDY